VGELQLRGRAKGREVGELGENGWE
jgi:hypothetical protein